jgi:hypothetical protein
MKFYITMILEAYVRVEVVSVHFVKLRRRSNNEVRVARLLEDEMNAYYTTMLQICSFLTEKKKYFS